MADKAFEVTAATLSGGAQTHQGDKFTVTAEGALLIYAKEGPLVAAYAPAQWVRVYQTGNLKA